MFLYWIVERYKIHLKKDIKKLDPPWTNDPILQTYSFTNVRRLHDRVTKFVLKHICYNDQLNIYEKACNCFWFRIFNQPATFLRFKFPIKESLLKKDFKEIMDYYSPFIQQNAKLHRGAYMNSGVLGKHVGDDKDTPIVFMPFYRMWKFYHSREFQTFKEGLESNNAEQVFKAISNQQGIGNFLAYQIYVDITYCPQTAITQNELVYLGNGALAGVDYLCPNIPRKKRYKFVYYVKDNLDKWLREYQHTGFEQLMYDLPASYRNLSLSNIQNCFCQFSKYRKIFLRKKNGIKKMGVRRKYGVQAIDYQIINQRFQN